MKNRMLAMLLLANVHIYAATHSLRPDDYKAIRTALTAAFKRSDSENSTLLQEIYDVSENGNLRLMLSLARNNHWLPAQEKENFSKMYTHIILKSNLKKKELASITNTHQFFLFLQ